MDDGCKSPLALGGGRALYVCIVVAQLIITHIFIIVVCVVMLVVIVIMLVRITVLVAAAILHARVRVRLTLILNSAMCRRCARSNVVEVDINIGRMCVRTFRR